MSYYVSLFNIIPSYLKNLPFPLSVIVNNFQVLFSCYCFKEAAGLQKLEKFLCCNIGSLPLQPGNADNGQTFIILKWIFCPEASATADILHLNYISSDAFGIITAPITLHPLFLVI